MGSDYRGLFEEWEVAIAVRLVKDAMVKWDCLRWAGETELVEECLVHWYRKRHRYDSSQEASPRTFMAQVVRNKIRDIVDFKMAQKRRDEIYAISLDDPLGVDDSELDLSRDYPSDADRNLDVSRALQGLTDRQKHICDLLTDENLTMDEIAKKAGIHRSTLYAEKARITRWFERKGLGDYRK